MKIILHPLVIALMVSFSASAQTIESEKIIKELILKNLLNVFNERNATSRKKIVNEIYTPNPVLTDPIDHVMVGRDSVNAEAEAILQMYPGFVFTQTGEPELYKETGRIAWNFGPAGNPPEQSGFMIMVFNRSKIQSVSIFVTHMRGKLIE